MTEAGKANPAGFGRSQRRNWMLRAAGLAIMFMLAAPAAAQEHFDVLLYENSHGDLAVGAVDVDTAVAEPDTRVLEGELLGDTTSGTPTFVGEEPGFFSYSDAAAAGPPPGFPAGATNLPADAEVSLSFLREPTLGLSLAYWNDGLGTWEAPETGTSILMSTLLDPGGSIDGTSEILDMTLGSTSGVGFLDDHPDFELSMDATTGAYLAYGIAEVEGFADPSDPFWLVFGTLDECEETDSCSAAQEAFNENIELQIEGAIVYTSEVLVPEPSTALLLGLGLAGFARVPRRHRT